MQPQHLPMVNARYWAAILLASISGTNLGDLYAHDSGLGLIGGLPVLAALVAVAFLIERRDTRTHEFWYWAAILVIRTGATNISDYLALGNHMVNPAISVPIVLLGSGGLVAWFGRLTARNRDASSGSGLPATGGHYWSAMLAAGVFGTITGDITSFMLGGGTASLVLTALLAGALVWGRGRTTTSIAIYWLTIAIARTAGTAIGDWLAENKVVGLGLPLATVITTATFIGLLVVWRSPRNAEPALA